MTVLNLNSITMRLFLLYIVEIGNLILAIIFMKQLRPLFAQRAGAVQMANQVTKVYLLAYNGALTVG